MKSIIGRTLAIIGYKVVKIDYYSRLFHINTFYEAGALLLLGRRFYKNEPIVCLDIGANIGQTTLKIKSFFPNAVVYAFEPVKDTCRLLIKNTSHLEDVHVFQKAVGNVNSTFNIYHRKDSEWNSLVPDLNNVALVEGGKEEEVEVCRLDTFMRENDLKEIDFLKSDTEGFELEVLQGANESLTLRKFNFIYFEVGFTEEDKQHVHWQKIVDNLKPYDYHFIGFFDANFAKDLKIHFANALFVRG